MNKLKYNFIVEVSICCPPRSQLVPLLDLQHLILTLIWQGYCRVVLT